MDTARRISLDNGTTYQAATEAMPEIIRRNMWQTVVQNMDDDTRERTHAELAPCSELEFLQGYLQEAPHDLIVG